MIHHQAFNEAVAAARGAWRKLSIDDTGEIAAAIADGQSLNQRIICELIRAGLASVRRREAAYRRHLAIVAALALAAHARTRGEPGGAA
ncbi:MAG TPA: hypothetical protein VGB90_09640 [Alphaproteobacteria bacterium]|jgi:hypothetical protein